MIEIKTLKETDEKLDFVIKNINVVIANTLRRLVISETPIMAIEIVNVLKNSSALYDEMIAHRLGLIPLKTDLTSYNLKKKCKCKGKGCALCELTLSLKAIGPCTVYAEDIKSKDPGIKPIYPKMPIVKLLKGQLVDLEIIAILGTGKSHAKFSPGLVYYQAYPKIKVTNCKGSAKCAEVCPKDVFKIVNKKVKVVNPINCILCNACEEACPHNAIKIEDSKIDFIFHVESWGQLKPKKLLLTAIDMLEDKLDEFNKKIKKIK